MLCNLSFDRYVPRAMSACTVIAWLTFSIPACQPKADDADSMNGGGAGTGSRDAGAGGSGAGKDAGGGTAGSGGGAADKDAGPRPDMDGGARDAAESDSALADAAPADAAVPPVGGPLQIEVAASANPVVPNGRVLLEVTVSNVTTRAIDAIRVLLRVPEGLQFNDTADVQPNSSACSGNVCAPNREVTWNVGTLGAGENAIIAINAQVLDSVGDGDSIDAMFQITATGIEQVNLVKSLGVYSSPSAQLAIATAVNPVTAGSTVRLELGVGQIDDAALTGAKLKVSVPTGLEIGAISDDGEKVGAAVEWDLGSVAVGHSLTRSLEVTVAPGAVAGTQLLTRAELSHGGGPDVDQSSELILRVVDEELPLEVNLSLATNQAVPGGHLLYEATISNLSQRDVEGVMLGIRGPDGLEFNDTGDTRPNSGACSGNICRANVEAWWELGNLTAGTSHTVRVNAVVDPAAVGDGSLIPLHAFVWSTGNSLAAASKIIHTLSHPAAQLSVRSAENPVLAGQSFTLDVDVGQIGATALASTELRLTLPSGATVGEISDGGSEDGGAVAWTLGSVGVGSAVHRSVELTVNGDVAPGALLAAWAVLTHEGGPEVGFASEHVVTVVADPLPLEVEVTTSSATAVPDGRLLYTATIRNAASRAVDGIDVFLRVPAGIEFNDTNDTEPNSSACSGNVCAGHREVTWTIASLPVGMAQTIEVNAHVLATTAAGTLISAPFIVSSTGTAQEAVIWRTVPAAP